MKSEIITCIALLLLAAGYYAYPHIQHTRFEAHAQQTITEFEARIESYRAAHRQQLLSAGSYHIAPEDDPAFRLNFVYQYP